MTPAQAMAAALILERNAPSVLEGAIACTDVAAFLRDWAKRGARWEFADGTLIAADPGKADRWLRRVSDFAAVAGDAFRAPNFEIDATTCGADRAAVNSKLYRLAQRLAREYQPVLARAVRDIHLEQRGTLVIAVYAPEGLPVRLEN